MPAVTTPGRGKKSHLQDGHGPIPTDLANVTPEKALMIGDSFEADILGALDMKMHVIHVDFDKKYTHLLCPIVHHLSEIEKFL